MRADPCTHELALTCLYLRCIVVFFCGRRNRHRTVGRRASPNPQKLLFPQLAWSVPRKTAERTDAKSPFPAQVLGGKNNADRAIPGQESPLKRFKGGVLTLSEVPCGCTRALWRQHTRLHELTTLCSEGRTPRTLPGPDLKTLPTMAPIDRGSTGAASRPLPHTCVGERISMSGEWWETQ